MPPLLRKSASAVLLLLAAGAVTGGFLVSGGCTSSYNRQEFTEAYATARRDTLGLVHYTGRKAGYDHFHFRYNVGGKNFRVPVAESPIREPFDYTKDIARWRVLNSTDPTDPAMLAPEGTGLDGPFP